MEYKNQTENRAFREMLQVAVKRLQNRSGEDIAEKSGAVFHSSRNMLEVQSFHEVIEIQLPEFYINSDMDEWHYLTLLHYLDMADGTEAVSYTHLDVYKRQELDEGHAIFEISIPEEWIGKTIGQLDIRKKYNINIMALKTNDIMNLKISSDTQLLKDSTMLVLGQKETIKYPYLLLKSETKS